MKPFACTYNIINCSCTTTALIGKVGRLCCVSVLLMCIFRMSIFDPCLPLHMTYHLSSSNPPVTLIGTGDYMACREALVPLLSPPSNSDYRATNAECSEEILYELPINFTTMPFYGFSEFWYSMNDVLGLGGKYDRTSFDSHAAVRFFHTIKRACRGGRTRSRECIGLYREVILKGLLPKLCTNSKLSLC